MLPVTFTASNFKSACIFLSGKEFSEKNIVAIYIHPKTGRIRSLSKSSKARTISGCILPLFYYEEFLLTSAMKESKISCVYCTKYISCYCS